MAFPTVASVTQTAFQTDATAHQVAMPATVNSGDLLVTAFGNFASTATVTTPSGWNLLHSNNPSGIRYGTYYRIADGSEGGTTVNWVTSTNRQAVGHVYRITGWHGTTPPEVPTAVTGNSTTPDPPALTPSWGAADTLWIAVSFGGDPDTVVSYPTNYTGGVENQTTEPNACYLASARRNVNTATEDPGVFTMSTNAIFVAQTIGVRPAAGGATGTLAATQDDNVGAFTGTVANPISGTLSATQADNTGAFTGSVGLTGTLAATQDPNVGAFTGQVANPITGILGAVQADNVANFTGQTILGGNLTAVQDDNVGAFTGTVANPVTGILGATQDDNTAAFTGTVGASPITGILAGVQDDNVAAFTGTVVANNVTGVLSAVQDPNVGSFTGNVANPISGLTLPFQVSIRDRSAQAAITDRSSGVAIADRTSTVTISP